jgi:DNA-binding beta-propeller fold protein YncE
MLRQSISIAFLAIGLAVGGCDPLPLTDSGVLNVFGGVGLGQGFFSYPRAITADLRRGTIFVADKSGRIQRFSENGQFEVGWRMPETAHGKPVGVKVHPDGRVFVADTHYHRVLVFDADGRQLASFGSEGLGDGQFQLPTDVAFDAAGRVYVSEYHGNDRISQWSAALEFLQHFGVEPIDGKRLARPTGLAVDDEQTLWTADACNHRVVRFSLDGQVLSTFGGYGREPGEMRYPYDLDLAPDGSILVCEYEGNRLQWFSREGRSLRTWGSPGRKPGELFAPWGAVYGPNGRVYVCDSLNERVQVVRP